MTANAPKAPMLLPCLRGVMGDWVYYSSTMSARQVAAWIEPAHHIRESHALEDFLQRKLKPRSEKIARYISSNPSWFFNSMIVGVFGGIPEWHALRLREGGHIGDVMLDATRDELEDTLGVLSFSGMERMFAIDGQHRAAAIQQVAGRKQVNDEGAAQVPVIFVAHVDSSDGKKRSRRLFADINKRAVPVSKGDLAVIDEEDVNCLAARWVFANYAPLKGLVAVTERPEIDISDDSCFTNLLTLVQITAKIKSTVAKRRGVPAHDADYVRAVGEAVGAFFDFMFAAVPALSVSRSGQSAKLRKLRLQERNMFLRPVGQVAIADAFARLAKMNRTNDLATALATIDLALNGPIFSNVLWRRGKVLNKGRTLATRLLIYKSGALSPPEETDLLADYRRFVDDDNASLP